MAHQQSRWQRAILALFHLSPGAAVLLCGGLFAAVAVADVLTPPQLNLSLFYAFTVLLATWNVGLAGGLAFAVAAAGMQWIVLSEHPAPVLYSIYWWVWLVDRWFNLFIVVALTHPLRVLFDRHQAASRIDGLTGAANQKYFRELLAMEINRSLRSGEEFAVAVMDCDDFKLINDEFGHVIGDSVLRTVVEIAKKCTRRSDTVARLGGDEFAILLPATSHESAREIVHRLQSRVHEQKISQWATSLSIGLATFDRTPIDAERVIALCDSLMYRAKRSGKGQIAEEHFAESMDPRNDVIAAPPADRALQSEEAQRRLDPG